MLMCRDAASGDMEGRVLKRLNRGTSQKESGLTNVCKATDVLCEPRFGLDLVNVFALCCRPKQQESVLP